MLANFSDREQTISGARLRQLGLRRTVTDLLAGQVVLAAQSLEMAPCQFMVLAGSRGG
jgi:amylosucrase